jgi:hypothetical protein
MLTVIGLLPVRRQKKPSDGFEPHVRWIFRHPTGIKSFYYPKK